MTLYKKKNAYIYACIKENHSHNYDKADYSPDLKFIIILGNSFSFLFDEGYTYQ